mmetsp:Transcript_26425/g.48589  ORF Transcript_26425/g.48589 Transcript_26425/m.48589 type:complete len:300 (+) Transcript_26425:129-1028(+)
MSILCFCLRCGAERELELRLHGSVSRVANLLRSLSVSRVVNLSRSLSVSRVLNLSRSLSRDTNFLPCWCRSQRSHGECPCGDFGLPHGECPCGLFGLLELPSELPLEGASGFTLSCAATISSSCSSLPVTTIFCVPRVLGPRQSLNVRKAPTKHNSRMMLKTMAGRTQSYCSCWQKLRTLSWRSSQSGEGMIAFALAYFCGATGMLLIPSFKGCNCTSSNSLPARLFLCHITGPMKVWSLWLSSPIALLTASVSVLLALRIAARTMRAALAPIACSFHGTLENSIWNAMMKSSFDLNTK